MPKRNTVSDLGCHVGYWMRFVSNHVSHAFMQKLEAKGVTVAEWALMRQLLELGPVYPSVVADQMGMTRGAISKLIDRLRDKELVAKTSEDGDRRFQTVTLTKTGKSLVPVLARLADENDRQFFGHLSPVAENDLIELLKEIVQRNGWKDLPIS